MRRIQPDNHPLGRVIPRPNHRQSHGGALNCNLTTTIYSVLLRIAFYMQINALAFQGLANSHFDSQSNSYHHLSHLSVNES